MKAAYVLVALCSLHIASCNKPSDRATGVHEQPVHEYDQNPATLPTATPEPAAANKLEDPDTAPQEDPQAMGTTRSPQGLDVTDGGLTSDPGIAEKSAQPKRNASKPVPQ